MTDDHIKGNRDYAIMLVASRFSKEELDEEPGYFKYKLKVERIDSLMDLKETKPVEFEKGRTPGQKQRWIREERVGKENYNACMGYILSRIDSLTDDYLDTLSN